MRSPAGNSSADQQLVDQVLRGDERAFGELVHQTEGLVAQIVFKMIAAPGDRQDIVQDVYLKAYKNLPGFRFQSKLSTWIGKITYNTCLHYVEKRRLALWPDGKEAEVVLQMGQNDTERLLLEKELAAVLEAGIRALSPPIYQTLIGLYHQQELSYSEICEITSLPEGTVKNYLFRARKALKEYILANYKREEL